MDGLLSLLVFAVLFYVMMRFGCGAHMVHGRHGRHGSHGTGEPGGPRHTDPVCGMNVAPDKGYGKMHEGALYRFCSRGCLDKFEAEPQRYLTRPQETQP
jgi:YHS domain-containing protein